MLSLRVNELVGYIKGYSSLIMTLEAVCPASISFENIEGGKKGYYQKTEKRIAIHEGLSEVQTVKIAIYEMARHKLHAVISSDEMNQQSRNSKEVEAESITYVICQHYRINISDCSFGYVAGWSEGKGTPELKAFLDTIRNATTDMITAMMKFACTGGRKREPY